MAVAVEVENLSKQYRLGSIGTGALSHDINRWWHTVRGKEDPYLKIGEVNDRTKAGSSDYVWSLRDINFKIEQGDAVGIIGRNGAGKSTLLKILSRVTAPTTGSINIKGRVASLLEVGTGFHPELSGRENIFLNGAILGMRKAEVKRKFDEIVDFAGVERYIDTPVKRYSSGMYVRLAFGVAAHLESEILIVDEVLAVGDAEFQKKCLGKMGDVSKGEGRTVLFVSHNMAAVKTLCTSGLFLKNGTVMFQDTVEKTVNYYLKDSSEQVNKNIRDRTDRLGNGKIKVIDIFFKNKENAIVSEIMAGDYLKIEIKLQKATDINLKDVIIALSFTDSLETPILLWISDEMNHDFSSLSNDTISFEVPSFNLRPNCYNFNYQISYKNTAAENFCDSMSAAHSIYVLGSDFFKNGRTIRSGNSSLLTANFIDTF